jgi:hypothetical protein
MIYDKPKISLNEDERLESLKNLNILNTLPEERFNYITRIASEFLNVPASQINLVDEDKVWIKSAYGIEGTESPRDLSFCAHTINENDIL